MRGGGELKEKLYRIIWKFEKKITKFPSVRLNIQEGVDVKIKIVSF